MTRSFEPAAASEPPLVSALIAAYKADSYLELAIGDALAQTHRRVEVIVSDDANSDATRAIVERFNDLRLTYRANPTRLGVAGNHRVALAAARGEFVSVLNHDDRWLPTFLEELTARLVADSEAVLAFCDHWVIDKHGNRLVEATDKASAHWGRAALVAGQQASFPHLVARQTIPLAMGAVFRRSAVDPVDLPLEAGPAYDIWLAYLLGRTGGAAHYVGKRLSEWRTHTANLTSAGGADWTAGSIACWEAVAADPAFTSVRREAEAHAAVGCRALGLSLLRQGHRSAARAAALKALRRHPTDLRAWAVVQLSCLPGGLTNRLIARRV